LEAEGSLHAALQAFSMIIVSEIGDKTFLIAAIMAMRHPRVVVFAGAFASLVVMSILSAAMGHVLPTLIPKRWTQLAAGVLFLVFGAKLFREGMEMSGGNEKVLEEMREAEEEIDEDVAAHEGTGRVTADGDVIPLEEIEAGGRTSVRDDGDGDTPPKSPKLPSALKDQLEGVRNLCSFLFGPVFVQVFVLTFLGEWGDRSQIATIMLAAAHVSLEPLHPVSAYFSSRLNGMVECIPCRDRNDSGSHVLYRACRHRGPLYFHKNLGKTWYAFLSLVNSKLNPFSPQLRWEEQLYSFASASSTFMRPAKQSISTPMTIYPEVRET
jgi:Ca2+/H+ antiporter, TMEM165/GDT1 family